MSAPHFYHATLDEADTECELDQQEVRHALSSRRLGVGQQVKLINGKGLVAVGSIDKADRREMTVAIDSIEIVAKPDKQRVILTAVPKGERQRFLVEALCQLGVDEIVPIICERSISKLNEKTFAKWQRYCIEACKQSQNPFIPELRSPIELTAIAEYWSEYHSTGKMYYADGAATQLFSSLREENPIGVVVGPEGGFSPQERLLLENSTFGSAKLSSAILRTEIASISALAQLQ